MLTDALFQAPSRALRLYLDAPECFKELAAAILKRAYSLQLQFCACGKQTLLSAAEVATQVETPFDRSDPKLSNRHTF